MSTRIRTIVGWVLAILLAAAYAMSAIGKLTGAATEMFAGWGYPAWFATLIGGIELVGAAGLLIPKTRRWAVLGLTVVMLGAAYTHLSNNEAVQVSRPLIFLVALWVTWWLRRAPKTDRSAASA